MDTVGIAELRQNLSKYLKRVAEGESLMVTDHNKPVAMLAPTPDAMTHLDRLIAEGRVKPPRRPGPLPKPIKFGNDDISLSQSLDETRAERDFT